MISALVDPVASPVAIPGIQGQPVQEARRSTVGIIELPVNAPGLMTPHVGTQGVLGGTTVDVPVKPDVGGDGQRAEVTLDPDDRNAAGRCFSFATFNLGEGACYAEAAATYRTPRL